MTLYPVPMNTLNKRELNPGAEQGVDEQELQSSLLKVRLEIKLLPHVLDEADYDFTETGSIWFGCIGSQIKKDNMYVNLIILTK